MSEGKETKSAGIRKEIQNPCLRVKEQCETHGTHIGIKSRIGTEGEVQTIVNIIFAYDKGICCAGICPDK